MLVKMGRKRSPWATLIEMLIDLFTGKWYSVSLKTKHGLPYDPAIPLMGVYPNKAKTLIQNDAFWTLIQNDTLSISVFIIVLFTVAKIQKQSKWMDNDVYIYIYSMECYLVIKRRKIWHLQHGKTWRVLCLVRWVRQRKILISLISHFFTSLFRPNFPVPTSCPFSTV